VDAIREWIEGFLRGRYGYEGYRALWVLAVLVLIGPILVAVWQLAGPLLCVGTLALVLLLLGIERTGKLATAILVVVVLVALAVVLAGLDQPLHLYPWDVVPRLVGWWRALCTELRSR
jgi:hypothetical protein